MSSRAGRLDWISLCALGLIWGASFLGVTVALEGFGPLTVAAMRIALGAIVLVIIAYAMGVGLPKPSAEHGKRIWLHCFGFAVFTNALPFSLLSWAQLEVTSGFAGITMAVVPLFVLPLARVVLNEPMTTRRILGFCLGFAGVLVLIGPTALGGIGSTTENLARLACVSASLCYALGTMITRTTPSVPLISYSAGGLLLGALMIVPIALLIEGPPEAASLLSVSAVFYLGIFPTAVATLLLVRVINSAGPTFLSQVNYQVPLWAVTFGILVLGENVPSTFAIALVLILGGLAISEAKGRRFHT